MYAITAHINLMNSMITCGIESHESEAREHPEVVVRGRGRWGVTRSSWAMCSTLATRIATGQPWHWISLENLKNSSNRQ